MLNYIIDTQEYYKITIVGYDNFIKGEQKYYFPVKLINDRLKYLVTEGVITKDGKIGNDPTFEHSPEKTYKYLINTIEENKDIQFNFITNMKFENKYKNLNTELV